MKNPMLQGVLLSLQDIWLIGPALNLAAPTAGAFPLGRAGMGKPILLVFAKVSPLGRLRLWLLWQELRLLSIPAWFD